MKNFIKIIWEDFSWVIMILLSILIIISINLFNNYLLKKLDEDTLVYKELPQEYIIYSNDAMEISNITRNLISDDYLSLLYASNFTYIRSQLGKNYILYDLVPNTTENIDEEILTLSIQIKNIWRKYGYNLNIIVGLLESEDSDVIYRCYTNGRLDCEE